MDSSMMAVRILASEPIRTGVPLAALKAQFFLTTAIFDSNFAQPEGNPERNFWSSYITFP
jgi:hypothetical protein